jgi:hypothetical protein
MVYETRQEAVAALDDWATGGDESLVYCETCAKLLNSGVYHEIGDHLIAEAVYELAEEDEPVYTLVERFCDQCETRYFPDAEGWRICSTCRREYGLEG